MINGTVTINIQRRNLRSEISSMVSSGSSMVPDGWLRIVRQMLEEINNSELPVRIQSVRQGPRGHLVVSWGPRRAVGPEASKAIKCAMESIIRRADEWGQGTCSLCGRPGEQAAYGVLLGNPADPTVRILCDDCVLNWRTR